MGKTHLRYCPTCGYDGFALGIPPEELRRAEYWLGHWTREPATEAGRYVVGWRDDPEMLLLLECFRVGDVPRGSKGVRWSVPLPPMPPIPEENKS